MIDHIILIPVLVFVVITLFGFGLMSYVKQRDEQNRLKDKIDRGAGSFHSVRREDNSSNESGSSFKTRLLNIATRVGKSSKPKTEEEFSHMRKSLIRAGYRKENAVGILCGIKIMLAIFMPLFLFFIKVFITGSISPTAFMVLLIIAALFGFYLPNVWLSIQTDIRKRKILEGFPDVLDLLVVCVEAGMGLDAAIDRAGREMEFKNKIISDEFKILSLELRAGKLRNEALRNLAMRADLEDVSSLISLLIQTDRFGTSVAQALRVHSESMRTKRYQRAEEIAAKLPVKMVFPLIIFIFPSLFVTLLGPAAIKVYRSLLPHLSGG